jgi:hypothetical protein
VLCSTAVSLFTFDFGHLVVGTRVIEDTQADDLSRLAYPTHKTLHHKVTGGSPNRHESGLFTYSDQKAQTHQLAESQDIRNLSGFFPTQ